MGTLRKMGAFLGLVPDENEQYGARSDRGDRHHVDDHDAADYDAADYHPDDYRSFEQDARYAVDDVDAAGHDRPREADGYQHRDEYAADVSDSGAYSADGYGHDGADHGGRELEYAGRYTDDSQADHSAYSPYAGADRSASVDTGARSLLGGGRRSASRSGRGAGRQNEDVDYSTQGALAVQPQPVEAVSSVDPTTGKPATVSLSGFADAREVGELYRTGQAVILDMTELTDAEARRMVDFAAGLAFAVRGSIDKVTTKVFMLHQPDSDTDRSGR